LQWEANGHKLPKNLLEDLKTELKIDFILILKEFTIYLTLQKYPILLAK
jgi:hypothetical protein